jgi:hypothetical protein
MNAHEHESGQDEPVWLWVVRARPKQYWPQMNADKRGLKAIGLSAFIGVHPRPEFVGL